MENFYFIKDNKLFLNVHINPNSKKDEIKGFYNGKLKIKISAPAVNGKANKNLINFISKIFKISKTKIKIIKGEISRDKVLEISNYDNNILKKLEEVKNANL